MSKKLVRDCVYFVFLASGTCAALHCFVVHPAPCCLFAPPHFLCTFCFQVTTTMSKRTATGPSTLPKRERVAMGVNLRTISESMSVADIANDFNSLKTGISALSSPGIPNLDSRGLRALEVVFLKVARSNPELALGYFTALGAKLGRHNDSLDSELCSRMSQFLGDFKKDRHPDASTLRLSLLAAVLDTDATRKDSNRTGNRSGGWKRTGIWPVYPSRVGFFLAPHIGNWDLASLPG